MSWLGLEGKVAIVTGGGAGLGAACSKGLSDVGAKVVVADINEEGGNKIVEELDGEHVFAKVNVTDRESVDGMIKTAMDAFGRIDILVNNAGILIPRLLVDPAGKEEMTPEIWDKTMAINQRGYYLCAQAAAREMMKNAEGGVLVNMTSESGMEGSEGQSAYAATKGAIYNMTRSWAKELGKQNVRVVGVAPGIMEATDLRSEEYERAVAYTRGISVDEFRDKYKDVSIPLGRSGKLSEVSDLVCFLASERASYIHGTTVNISGGKSRA